MKKPRNTRASAALAMVSNRIMASGLLLLCILFLGVSSASALPIATNAKCNPDWPNNPGADKCVTQEEQDITNNVAHPHYVACTSDGTLFCCVDNDNGGQDCTAIEDATLGTRGILGDLQLDATIGGQQATATGLSQIQQQLKDMKTELDTLLQNQCGQQPPVQ